MTCFSGDYNSIETVNIKPFLFQHHSLFSRVLKELILLEAKLTFCNFIMSHKRPSQEETKITAIAWTSRNC